LCHYLVLGLLALLGLVVWERSRSLTLHRADAHAASRALRDFHAEYLKRKGVDWADYQSAVASFAEKHPNPEVQRYAWAVGEKGSPP
jgi:hypothetical protein